MSLDGGRAAKLLLVAVAGLLIGIVAPAWAQDVPPTEAPPTGSVQEPADEPDPCADARPWERPACEVREGISAGVSGLVAAGLTSVFEQLYEWVAGGATWLLSQLVTLIDSSTRPHVTADWFARQYALMGGLALMLVTPLLLVATIGAVVRQDWRGLLRSYFVYLPAAMVGTAIAIPLVDMAVGITDWMSALFLEPLRGDIETFTSEVTSALSDTSTATAGVAPGVAPFLMFLGAALIALGAFAVWVELVLRAAGIYVALFFLPLGFAALVWPATRKWFGRLVKGLAALILSKFVIVAVIALAAAALGNLGGDDGTGFGGVIAGSALMLMAAFSPLVLFRLADVAGDEIAGAIEGVTQHRTSPVPTPSPQQSASKMYGRIMNGRAAGDGAGKAAAGARGVSTTGAAAATGGAAVAAGAVATAVKAPGTAGQAAGERLDGVMQSNGSPTSGSAPPTSAHSPNGARPQPGTSAPPGPTAPRADGAPPASPPPEQPPARSPRQAAAPPPRPEAGPPPPRPAPAAPPPHPPTDPT